MPFFRVCVLLVSLLLQSTQAQNCWKNLTCTGPTDTAFPGVWESNIFAPSSRLVSPASILSLQNGQVISSFPGNATFSGNGSALVFDFGIEVGGLVHLEYESTGPGSLGLAFTEAKNWIGEWSDSSNGKFVGPDGALYATFNAAGTGNWTQPDVRLRGGFRYLTIFLVTNSSSTSVEIKDIKLEIGFEPTWSNLRAYQGYFHSSDDELNKIWYSGAYTLQTNNVPTNTGRWVPFLSTGWANNGTLGPGDTIIVDGAKRDRAVWPGDMGVAVPSTFVSIGDLTAVQNALQIMYNEQDPTTGAFPESGPPLLQLGSDTYHMWTMIGSYNYVFYTNDTAFLEQNWAKYQLAMDYIYGKVIAPGLLNVTGLRDWARWQTGFNESEANMILYRTLITGADLAVWAGEPDLNSTWLERAASLKTAINKYCYDAPYGAFKDNATATTLHPQDANSMSVLFDVVESNAQAESISTKLLENWTPIGAVTPELPDNISPFISSFEIQAHFSIGETARALDLIRRSWGWYLNNPNGTQSTVIEGYLQNGTFGYRSTRGYDFDASYVSHSHGWSSGPTAALTTYVVGLSITARAGSEWKLSPQFGDLSFAEGGFSSILGQFQAGWQLQGNGYNISYNVPEGTTGQVILPCLTAGKWPTISVNGQPVPKTMSPQLVNSSFVLNVDGGQSTIVVS